MLIKGQFSIRSFSQVFGKPKQLKLYTRMLFQLGHGTFINYLTSIEEKIGRKNAMKKWIGTNEK